jgi:hypothetical protein
MRAGVRACRNTPEHIMTVRLTPEEWAQVRYKYEHTNEPVDDICLEHRISPNTLRDRVRRWRWTPRHEPIPAEGPPPMRPIGLVLPAAAALVPLVPAMTPIDIDAPFAPAAVPPGSAAELPAPPVAASEAAPPNPAEIVPRLQGAVARVLPAIEATVAKLAAGPMHPREMERAARTLTSLTRTLRELNGLLGQLAAPLVDRGPDDDNEFVAAIIRRAEAFAAAEAAKEAAGDQKEEERG